MQDSQILVLVIFSVPVAVMGWILWRVSIDLGSFGLTKREQQNKTPSIQIRAARPTRFSKLRSSRLDI